jgi:hypothetical protein
MTMADADWCVVSSLVQCAHAQGLNLGVDQLGQPVQGRHGLLGRHGEARNRRIDGQRCLVHLAEVELDEFHALLGPGIQTRRVFAQEKPDSHSPGFTPWAANQQRRGAADPVRTLPHTQAG